MNLNRRLMLGAGAAAIAVGGAAEAATRSSGGGRAHRTALSALSRYADQHVRDWGLPGMTICVVDRDGYAGFITTGYADVGRRTPIGPDHLFQIGSISKVFTALTLYSLNQEGKLSPNARLRQVLPNVAVANAEAVTLQHMLNHTSGLPGNAPATPDGGLWSGFTPGEHWHYSNTGYELLSRAIAQADGKLFHESVEARVMAPLGMTHSHAAIRSGDRDRFAQGYETLYADRPAFRPGPIAPAPWVNVESGAGCIAATSGDMAFFLRYLIELAQGRGGPVLSDASAAQFMANPAAAPEWSETAKYGNGLARLSIEERDYLHHTGGMVSFSSSMHVDVEAGIAAYASSNIGVSLNYRPRDVSLYACRLFRSARDGAAAPDPAPTRTTVNDPAKFVGVYTAASGDTFEIQAEGSNQIAMHNNGASSRMQSLAGPFFACSDARFVTTGLLFEAEGEDVARAWADGVEFVRGPVRTYQEPPPAELQRLAGIYDSDDRWSGPVWVIARSGKLWLNNADPLFQLPDGSWRPGTDEWIPERIRFDGYVNGRPTRLLVSGAPFVRRFS
ncbi:MAG: beta-lactamase family protein [Hyphomonadaceae bacterium]|nr:beta-lactamase family protein [Hyphomonadaceae bacterium]